MYKKEDEKEVILEAKEVSKSFLLKGEKQLKACDEVNLKVYRGKTLGIVGESGCGKSTFVKMILGILKPDNGEIFFEGKDITKLKGESSRQMRKHIQMIFQDPLSCLNPKMRVMDIVCEPLFNFNRIRKKEKEEKAKELMRMVELPEEFIYRYPHNMSGGQRQRVGIARALALEPSILICDEATCALDVSVQKKMIELLVKIQKKRQLTILFICHDLALVQSFSHEIAIMYLGNIVEVLPSNELVRQSKHPYTKALIESQFSKYMDFSKKIEPIQGDAPSPVNRPNGCLFENRCEYVKEKCKTKKCSLKEFEFGHKIACHLLEEQ